MNPGESVLEALKREVAEETGLQLVPVRLLYIAESVDSVRDHSLEFGLPHLAAPSARAL